MLNKYLRMFYKEGARGENNLIDCWGLVRLVRHEVFKKPLLNEYKDVSKDKIKLIQKAYEEQKEILKEIKDYKNSSIVCLFFKGLCIHVGIIYNDFVLDINTNEYAKLTRIQDFLNKYSRPWEIKYYD